VAGGRLRTASENRPVYPAVPAKNDLALRPLEPAKFSSDCSSHGRQTLGLKLLLFTLKRNHQGFFSSNDFGRTKGVILSGSTLLELVDPAQMVSVSLSNL
jgi:hypothetical protein